MARPSKLEKMSVAQLSAMQTRIERLKIEKQSSEREAVRKRLADMAKEHGFDIRDLFGKGRKGKVAVKYRDPKNPGNTWTGRGRMPRWLTAETKNGKKRDDFLI
jgi:DNA-binding protein H-NS